MDTLTTQAIQQMYYKDSSDDAHKESEITAAVKKYAEECSNGQKSTTAECQSRTSSSFSIFRSSVLQYVENGTWNEQIPKTTTCPAVCSPEECVSRKFHRKKRPEKDISSNGERTSDKSESSKQSFPITASLEAPVTSELYKNDLQQLSLSDSGCSSNDLSIQTNTVKFDKYRKQVYWNDDSNPSGSGSDVDNLLSTFVVVYKHKSSERKLLSSSSTDSASSCEHIFDETGNFSSEEDPDVVSGENSVESSADTDGNSLVHSVIVSANEMPQIDAEDRGSPKENDSRTKSSGTDGLSTYTLHSRWEELLPKEVIHRISRENDFNRPLFGNFESANISTDFKGRLAYPMQEISTTENGKNSRNGITLGNGTVESNLGCDDIPEKKHSFSSGRKNSFMVNEPSAKSNSIQDSYRSILKTISNVGDGTIQSIYAGGRTRRSRKAKTKTPPVFVCPKCKSSYFVSSKKAIAISRCMQCDLWTSVEAAEAEEEVPSSYCCLS